MSVWGILKNLKLKEVSTLSKIFLKHPRYFIPTLRATLETIKVCDDEFGDAHHLDNPANAFRHAYWNFLICVKCYKVAGPREKVADWAKKITELHEDLSPNDELAREMDLHNNQIGREIFKKYGDEIVEPVKYFKELMDHSNLVTTIDQIKNSGNNYVHIEKSNRENEGKIL